jgi:solute carrier family 45, member 1/2/4
MDTEQERTKINSFMNNSSARMSHLDVHGAQGSRQSLRQDDDSDAVAKGRKGGNLAAKAGIILVCRQWAILLSRWLTVAAQGIHNIFIVMPQFVITGISSIIFALASTGDGAEEHSPGDLSRNSTDADLGSREGVAARGGGPNSYAYVFR